MQYEAILFDFDGVLVDSEPVHCECWQEILAPYGLQLDWETYCRHGIGSVDRLLLARLCNQVSPPIELERLVAEYPRKRALFQTRMLEREAFSADVLELIPQLSEYQLAVVTSSGQAEVESILIHAGIREHFRVAVFGGDVKKHKPDPEPYLLAVERLGVKTALVVEDSDAGIASATAAGLDVLRIHKTSDMPTKLRERLRLNGSPRRTGTF
ncbi:MAG TPA: HAD family phosphatase [Bryobacteraceae bacterium]